MTSALHPMDLFLHYANLERFRKLLAATTDEEQRRTLLRLLADEESKDQTPQIKAE